MGMLKVELPGPTFFRQLDYARWRKGEKVEWIDAIFAALDEQENDSYKKYQVNWEPAIKGDWTLTQGEIPRRSYERLHHVLDGPHPRLDRDCGWGPITVLKHNGKVWMSDTRAEILEHAPLLNRLWWLDGSGPRVLINGLGLGMAVKAALTHGASHVDVVEIDQDVIDIIGPNFKGEPVKIHHADALQKAWPKGAKWDLAWHDIWPTISVDNLPEMELLHRKYGSRVEWQASWQQDGCRNLRKADKELHEALEAGDWDAVKRLDPDF